MKFTYTGHCAAGFVQFTHAQTGETVKMPEGKAVDVPDWLAKKLATNSHFEAAKEVTRQHVEESTPLKHHEAYTPAHSNPVGADATGNFDDLSSATAEQNDGKPRGKPGPKPKV